MSNQRELPTLTSEERLKAYQMIIDGCSHLWSKNQLREEKANEILGKLIPLTEKDPYFLAHFTSWAMKNSNSKDLRVFLTYVSSLSSADGLPFSPDSKYKKPNLRYVAWVSLHMLSPKLAERVFQVANRKYAIEDYLNESYHYPQSLKTAGQKYLKYREENLQMVEGIKKAGLGNVLKRLYQQVRYSPTEEVAKILRWPQKDGSVDLEESEKMFEGLSDLEIAQKIREEELPYIGVLGELSKVEKQVTPAIAVAMLEQATGNQAVIMRATFEDAGVLDNQDVMLLYEKKIKEAETTLDRAKTVSQEASEEVKKVLTKARAEKRKEQIGDIGKVFVHLDLSPSMEEAIEVAKEKGSILAEMIPNPEKNFNWGYFNDRGVMMEVPDEFTEDAFRAILFGKVCTGMTDAFQLYPQAREFGAEVDIFLTDGCHNMGNLEEKIRQYHQNHPDTEKPKAMVWINVYDTDGLGFSRFEVGTVQEAYEANGIPVAKMSPDTLTESALVTEAVQNAVMGPIAMIDTIMETPLLELPDYYYAV